jgi:hypothetical protein
VALEGPGAAAAALASSIPRNGLLISLSASVTNHSNLVMGPTQVLYAFMALVSHIPRMARNILRCQLLVSTVFCRLYDPKQSRLNRSTPLKLRLYVSCMPGYRTLYLVVLKLPPTHSVLSLSTSSASVDKPQVPTQSIGCLSMKAPA